MKNTSTAHAAICELIGKKLTGVNIHNSHGEILTLVFEGGKTLQVCSTHGLDDKSVEDDPNNIYISIDEMAL